MAETLHRSSYQKSYALCLGINDYVHLGPLNTATDCSIAVTEVFQNLGFDVTNYKNHEVTRDSVEEWLINCGKVAESDDRVFVYFAGHGLRRPTKSGKHIGYLGLYDTKPDYNRALNMQTLLDQLQFIKAKHVFIALDACFSGLILSRNSVGDPHILSKEDAEAVAENYTRRKAYEILAAGGAREYVYDPFPYSDSNLSVFTYFLLERINNCMRKGEVLAGYQLAASVRESVQSVVPEQVPQFGPVPGSHSEGSFVFVLPAKLSAELPYKGTISSGEVISLSISEEESADIARIKVLYEENWQRIMRFMDKLVSVIGPHPTGGIRLILGDKELISHLGCQLEPNEFAHYQKILDSPYREIEIETFRPRAKVYFLRLQKLISRFPSQLIGLERKQIWQNSLESLLTELGAIEDVGLKLRSVEDFAKSALALTRFTSTSLEPELMSALYLIKMIDITDKGGSEEIEKFLFQKIRVELESLIEPQSAAFVTELLDDESHIWWAVLELLAHLKEDFSVHKYWGIPGALQIIDRLLTRNEFVYPGLDKARREATLEVQTEQKTMLWISNLGIRLAQYLEINEIPKYPSEITKYIFSIQQPFLYGEKTRDTHHLFFWCLELEAWGRMIAWYDGSYRDQLGREIEKK